MTFGVPITVIPVFLLFFPPTTGYGMLANGSVGTGSSVISYPMASLRSETFLACLGISRVMHVRFLIDFVDAPCGWLVDALSPVNHKRLHQG